MVGCFRSIKFDWWIDLTCNQSTTWIPHRFVCCCFFLIASFSIYSLNFLGSFLRQNRWSKMPMSVHFCGSFYAFFWISLIFNNLSSETFLTCTVVEKKRNIIDSWLAIEWILFGKNLPFVFYLFIQVAALIWIIALKCFFHANYHSSEMSIGCSNQRFKSISCQRLSKILMFFFSFENI